MNVNREDQIRTFTGLLFAPAFPEKAGIRLLDIAHALSLLCRANGHFKQFFSVAQHSLNCAREAESRKFSKKLQLACLLHDASEAYISDVTRPVKRNLPEYSVLEGKLQDCIWSAFGVKLTQEEKKQVCAVDDAMLYIEFDRLMDEKIFLMAPEIKSAPDLSERDFKEVERDFAALCIKLMGASL
jgi:hypothetical protein